MITYRGVKPVTIAAGTTGNVTIPRGCRCSLSTDGGNTCYLEGPTLRGDFVTMQDLAPGTTGAAVRLDTGEEVVGVAAVAVTRGDALYSATFGRVTNSAAGGATYVGKARENANAGELFGVLLETVA